MSVVMEVAPMSAELFDRRTAAPSNAPIPDAAFTARERLVKLRDAFIRTAKSFRPPRWNEPIIFFFDRQRQAELEAARPAPPVRFADLTVLITAELPALRTSVEVRRVARAIGLNEAAAPLAPHCPAAKELTELLAVPDDEVFLVLTPATRAGVRLHLRGATNAAQLYRLLMEPIPSPRKEGESEHSSFGSSLPGEEIAPFQLFTAAAIQPDGTLPTGFARCEHWLWPTQPLTAIPRVNGERVVLVGPAAVRASLDVDPRFPALAVEREVVQILTVLQVTEELSRLCGHSLPIGVPEERVAVARAA